MKPTKNPWVIEKTKNTFERECSLADIPHVIRSDGTKGCIWCGDDLKTKHPLQRYCKDIECSKSAYIWGYPQKNEALLLLLKQQDYKCNICLHDYKQYFEDIFGLNNLDPNTFKKRIPSSVKPEVDHILAIIQGGQSLGLDNHQAICYTCHKAKTKKDIKGPKRVKSAEEILKQKDKRMMDKFYNKLGPFLQQNHSDGHSSYWKKYRDIFLPSLTIEELESKERDIINSPKRDYDPEFEELKWVKAELEKKRKNI